MAIVIIFIGVIVAGVALAVWSDSDILGLLGAIAVGVLLTILTGVLADHADYKVEKEVTELVALNDGSMFLGMGRREDELTYNYAIKKGEGYAIDYIEADQVEELRYIKDSSKPRIETSTQVYTNSFVSFLLAGLESEKTYIYVPKGTVQETYKVDLN
jgi:hypothetical protein